MLGSWSTPIDPIQLADKGARLTGELPLKGMRRLAELCWDEQGAVRVDLKFERDPGDGLRVMHGTVDARIGLTCQRCMDRYDAELHGKPRLVLLKPGERPDLVESGDAIVIERPTAVGILVEDELLLEMPMVPMHAPEQCPAREDLGARTTQPEQPARANPFAVLKKFKRTYR